MIPNESRPAGDRAAEEKAGRALSESTVDGRPDRTREAAPFQLMPPLSAAELAALRADVAERGVVVPVVLDQYGRLLDGHHRRQVAADLGVECPSVVRHVADDDEAADLAVTLNAARRHLSREQRQELVAAEIARRPGDSDRAIARRVGCDHKTVGAARRGRSGEVPHVSPVLLDPAEGEALTEQAAGVLAEVDGMIADFLGRGASPLLLVGALTAAQAEAKAEASAPVAAIARSVWQPRIDELMRSVKEVAR